MTSDRMMQAIGRMERAISRLEAAATTNRDRFAAQAREISRLDAGLRDVEQRHAELVAQEENRRKQPEPLPMFAEQDPHAMNPFSHDKALAALRSLDSLIDDLQKARRDG